MATFSIDNAPIFNVNYVERVKESDYVIADFVNGYYQRFLENDQALKNLVGDAKTYAEQQCKQLDKNVKDNAVKECTTAEIQALFL